MKEQLFAKDHPLACAVFATIGLGGGLSIKGRREFGHLIYQIASGGHIQVSQVTEKIFGGSKYRDEIIGRENIPTRGATLAIAVPHISAGSLRGIGKYAELCAAIYQARVDEKNEYVREPFMIMGDGVKISDLAFPFIGKRLSKWIIRGLLAFRGMSEANLQALIEDLYASGGYSFDWERATTPQFNEQRDIEGNQGADVFGIAGRLAIGGAGISFPQGENCPEDDFSVPQKASRSIKVLQYRYSRSCPASTSPKKLQVLPVRCMATNKRRVKIHIGEAMPIEEIIDKGKINLEDFAAQYIKPLGESKQTQRKMALVS